MPVDYLGVYNPFNDSEASWTLDGGIVEWIKHTKQAGSIYIHGYPCNQGKDLQSKMGYKVPYIQFTFQRQVVTIMQPHLVFHIFF